jgi:hypothetical protein
MTRAKSTEQADQGDSLGPQFTGVKIFSATLAEQRAALGETVTQWLRLNPQLEVVEKVVTQSSDNRFHCLTLVLFFRTVVEPVQPRSART